MWRNNLPLRVAGPTVLVSLLLLGLCATAALYLYSQQATSAEELGENVSSAQAAHDLENTLHSLAALLGSTPRLQGRLVGPLNERMEAQLAVARKLADKDEEKKLVAELDETLHRYLDCWKSDHVPPLGGDARAEALDLLAQALPVCSKLEQFNSQQTRDSEAAHRQTVKLVALGLFGLGTVGSVVGIFLGYSVARGLRHSITQLSVRVRDAAGKLGQDLPPVVVSENGDLHHLNKQVVRLVREIEQVVEQLQQREREVLRAEQLAAVGQLAAGLAHELRNPLTSIKILVQAIREEAAARSQPGDDLQIIEIEIQRMEKCLQTFLDFARPPKPEFHRLDVRKLIERTLTLVGSRARKQHVTVHFKPSESPVLAEVDADQIQQLLVNLTLNSLDAMPRGGAIDVELHRTGEDNVELRVSDSGPGIPPAMVPRLFEPFASSKETGLGLGLVISRRIAENHGGTLFALHRPQGGACFVFHLPAHAAGAKTQEASCPSC